MSARRRIHEEAVVERCKQTPLRLQIEEALK